MDGAFGEVPEQQRAIQRIVELRREGLSLRAISASIAEDGVSCRMRGLRTFSPPPARTSATFLVNFLSDRENAE